MIPPTRILFLPAIVVCVLFAVQTATGFQSDQRPETIEDVRNALNRQQAEAEAELQRRAAEAALQAAQPVEVTDDPATWLDVQPAAAGAGVKLPTEPRAVERTFSVVDNQEMTVFLFMSTVHDESTSLVFSYHDVQRDPVSQAIVTRTLSGAVRGAVANVLGTIESHKSVRHQNHRGREFVYSAIVDNQEIRIASRIFLVEKRLYSMAVVMKAENFNLDYCHGFFSTFQLIADQAPTDGQPVEQGSLNSGAGATSVQPDAGSGTTGSGSTSGDGSGSGTTGGAIPASGTTGSGLSGG